LVPDEQWIAAVRNVSEQDGPEQFLVNLLCLLRRNFGSIERDGDLPLT
jgi:hypothetical protein